MRNADGALFCSASGMEISQNLEARFHAIYVDGIEVSKPHQLDGVDILFCPGCAKRLVKGDDGTARYPECRRTMGGLVYEIIEFILNVRVKRSGEDDLEMLALKRSINWILGGAQPTAR